MRSQSGIYAQIALKSVREAEEQSYSKEYGRACLLFPSYVLANGLQLTITFYQKSGEKEQAFKQFLQDLGQALDIDDWVKALQDCSSMTRMMELIKRSLRAAVWFKRYAETILKVEFS